MAYWWSGHADGKTKFYKLPKDLSTHYGKFSERRQEQQTMVESLAQCQPNQKHIQSATTHAKALPALLPQSLNEKDDSLAESTVTEMNTPPADMSIDPGFQNYEVQDANELVQEMVVVDCEPVASSSGSATYLEHLGPAVLHHGTSATFALDLLRPKQYTTIKQSLSKTTSKSPLIAL